MSGASIPGAHGRVASDQNTSPRTRQPRVAHLLGGLRARCPGGSAASLNLVGVNESLLDWPLRSPGEFFGWLRWLGLTIVGCDTEIVPSPRPDLEAPLWQSHRTLPGGKGTSLRSRFLWSDLAHGCYEAGNLKLHDLAARVHFSLQATDWRLRELSESYARELSNLVENGKFEDGHRQYTGHTEVLFLALHAFFVESCILRDLLAEYIALVSHLRSPKGAAIRSMSALRPVLASVASRFPALVEELTDATNPKSPGWLAELGAYRNLIVHSGPLAMVSHGIFSRGQYLETAVQIAVPGIELPLPLRPTDLLNERSRGQHLRGSASWLERTFGSPDAETEIVDALAYCAIVLERLTDLSERLVPMSPVSPKPLRLTGSRVDGFVVPDPG